MSGMDDKPLLLVVTSTFPRWPGDREPPFVFELCRRLVENFEIHVLAPHTHGARRQETMDGIKVTRFPYFFQNGSVWPMRGGYCPT
jgi:hypothetical protein